MSTLKLHLPVLMAAALCAPLAFAQPTVSSESPAATSSDTLEEVVVTAQRRQEDVQKTAVSTAVVSGDDLLRSGAFKLDDAIAAVPAVNIIGGPAGFLVRIRGEGINIPPNDGDPSVPVMQDGLYNANLLTTFFGLYDVARVEVLRGPQGTLFGKNSTGGLVNYISNTPVDKEEGYASFSLGNYNTVQTQAMYNTPIDDQFDFRVSESTVYHQGYLTNGDGGQNSVSVRAMLKYKPSDSVSALLASEYSTDGGTPPGSVIGYSGDNPSATPAHGSSNPWYDAAPGGSWWDIRNWRTWADVEADFGWGVLSVLPSVQTSNTHWHNQFAEGMGSVASDEASLGTYLQTNMTQTAAEVHLASPDAQKWKWLIGAYYYDNPNWVGDTQGLGTVGAPVDGGQNYLNPASPTYSATVLSVKDYAVFAQTTIPVSDTTRLTLGARTQYDGKTINYINNEASLAFLGTTWDTSTSATKTTFKAGVEQDLNASSLLYAQVSSGFIGAAFNTTSHLVAPPETLTAYEIGSKNRFLDDRIQVNAEVYDNEVKNSQTFYSVPNPYLGETIGGVTITSPPEVSGVVPASAREYGGELETSWVVTPSDRLSLNAAYLHARFVQFSNTCVGESVGCPAGTSSPGYNGSVLPQSPTWTISGSLDHTFKLTDGSNITAHLDSRWHTYEYLIFNYKDAFPPFFPANSAYVPAASTSDFSLDWQSSSGKWMITGNIKNFTDTATKTGWFGPYVQVTDPRTYLLSVLVKF